MIVLFVIDLQHQILPNVITLPGIVVGLLLQRDRRGPGWLSSLIGIAVGAARLFAIAEIYYRVRHEEGLGMGDVKMLAHDRRVPRLEAGAADARALVVRRLDRRRRRPISREKNR